YWSAAGSANAYRRGTRRGLPRGRGTSPGGAPYLPGLQPVSALDAPPASALARAWERGRALAHRVSPAAAAAAPTPPSVAASRAASSRRVEFRPWLVS